jgi:hypothetical protein
MSKEKVYSALFGCYVAKSRLSDGYQQNNSNNFTVEFYRKISSVQTQKTTDRHLLTTIILEDGRDVLWLMVFV